jgi:hypothetical protein
MILSPAAGIRVLNRPVEVAVRNHRRPCRLREAERHRIACMSSCFARQQSACSKARAWSPGKRLQRHLRMPAQLRFFWSYSEVALAAVSLISLINAAIWRLIKIELAE